VDGEGAVAMTPCDGNVGGGESGLEEGSGPVDEIEIDGGGCLGLRRFRGFGGEWLGHVAIHTIPGKSTSDSFVTLPNGTT
jgi:hypothetical protein